MASATNQLQYAIAAPAAAAPAPAGAGGAAAIAAATAGAKRQLSAWVSTYNHKDDLQDVSCTKYRESRKEVVRLIYETTQMPLELCSIIALYNRHFASYKPTIVQKHFENGQSHEQIERREREYARDFEAVLERSCSESFKVWWAMDLGNDITIASVREGALSLDVELLITFNRNSKKIKKSCRPLHWPSSFVLNRERDRLYTLDIRYLRAYKFTSYDTDTLEVRGRLSHESWNSSSLRLAAFNDTVFVISSSEVESRSYKLTVFGVNRDGEQDHFFEVSSFSFQADEFPEFLQEPLTHELSLTLLLQNNHVSWTLKFMELPSQAPHTSTFFGREKQVPVVSLKPQLQIEVVS